MREVRGDTSLGSVVLPQRLLNIEMMPDRIFDPGEGPIVKEGRLQCRIAKRGTAELVTVVSIACNLLQAEILIFVTSVKNYVSLADAKVWGDLRNADVMHLEVAEHLVGLAADAVTGGAPSFAKEDQCSSLMATRHRERVAAGKFIERRVGIDLGEFKLGDSTTEHREVNRGSRSYFGKEHSKELAVSRVAVEPFQNLLPDRFVAKAATVRRWNHTAQSVVELIEARPNLTGCTGKACDFHQLSRRNVSLRHQQLPDDRIIRGEAGRAFG